MLPLTSARLQNAIANGDTRSLAFHHIHTKEELTVTFKREGRYDEDGLKKLNWLLRDWRRDEQTAMDPKLFDIVWELHRDLGSKERVHIISAYRSPQTNAMLRRRGRGVAKQSQHMAGKAMDFFIPGAPLEEVRAAGLRLERGGVGYYPTSGAPFVHVDTGSVRHWPRMTPDQLAKVFPNGRTVHLSTQGPMPNYTLALADLERRGDAATRATVEETQESSGSSLASKSKRFLAKLFGFESEEDDEEVETRPAASKQVAAAIPVPPARPRIVSATLAPAPPSRPHPTAEFTLASAASAPASAPQTPSDVIDARGFWRGAASPDQPTGTSGQRLVWQTGPEGRAVDRPPAPIRIRTDPLDPDQTASVARWPTGDHSDAPDRVPTDIALAYAANVPGDVPVTRASPMGTPRPAWQPPSRPAPQPAAALPFSPLPAVTAKVGHRYNDPWLRGVIVAPSVHYSMSVAVFGSPDYRELRPLMHKPSTVVAMVFSADPNLGMTSTRFTGSAVNFMSTVSFGQLTATLH